MTLEHTATDRPSAEPVRNAKRTGGFAERGLSAEDTRRYVGRPRDG